MTTKTWNGSVFIIDSGERGAASTSSQSATLDERDFLLKTNNLGDIPNRNIARQNLGITVSAVPPVAPKVNDLWVDLNN